MNGRGDSRVTYTHLIVSAFLSSEASLALALTKALPCEGQMYVVLSDVSPTPRLEALMPRHEPAAALVCDLAAGGL